MNKELETLLEKLEILNKTYLWSIKEAKKILDDTNSLLKSDDSKRFDKINKLRDKFIELQNRHAADKALYNKLINESRAYFKNKYKTDIIKLIEEEE
jgi:predicted nuclease with TOPRIM domain